MSELQEALPCRRHLYHEVPNWVGQGACFFVTICALPRRKNQLAAPERAAALLESVAHYHRESIWWVDLFLVMPDHIHALLAVAPDRSLPATIQSWKAWQTKKLGIRWQSGFFDHRLRSNETQEEKAAYIRENPIRAGLVSKREDWPYVWCGWSHAPLGSPGGFALPTTKVPSG